MRYQELFKNAREQTSSDDIEKAANLLKRLKFHEAQMGLYKLPSATERMVRIEKFEDHPR